MCVLENCLETKEEYAIETGVLLQLQFVVDGATLLLPELANVHLF